MKRSRRIFLVAAIAAAGALACLLCVAFVRHYQVQSKIKKVERDVRILLKALYWYEYETAFFPLPDYVKDLPERDFLDRVAESALFGTADTKRGYLEMELKTGPPAFLDGFEVFRHYAVWCQLDSAKFPQLAVEGHIVDPFDKAGRVYGYARGKETYCNWFILISSGPDGEREIDERDFDPQEPNLGYAAALETFAYDPTNGLRSRGDIFVIDPLRHFEKPAGKASKGPRPRRKSGNAQWL